MCGGNGFFRPTILCMLLRRAGVAVRGYPLNNVGRKSLKSSLNDRRLHANEHLRHADQINNQVIKVKKCGEGNNLVWLINCFHVNMKWVYQGEEP